MCRQNILLYALTNCLLFYQTKRKKCKELSFVDSKMLLMKVCQYVYISMNSLVYASELWNWRSGSKRIVSCRRKIMFEIILLQQQWSHEENYEFLSRSGYYCYFLLKMAYFMLSFHYITTEKAWFSVKLSLRVFWLSRSPTTTCVLKIFIA